MRLHAVILAAGSSVRLGRPKQNLVYQGQTLLQRTVACAQGVADHILVILGAHEAIIRPTLERAKVDILFNPHWKEGMSASVRQAAACLLKDHLPGHLLVLVCDQPFINAEFLEKLKRTAMDSGKGIVATAYGDTVGVPAIFSPAYLHPLTELKGDQGARHLMVLHQQDLISIPFDQAIFDIDTESDYDRLRGTETA